MYETVLMPLDLNERSSWEKALPAAGELCRASGGTLHVMTVLPGYGMNLVGHYFPEGAEEEAEAMALDELKKITAELVPEGIALEHSVVLARCMNKSWQRRNATAPIRSSWRRAAPASPISCSATMPIGWCAAIPIR